MDRTGEKERERERLREKVIEASRFRQLLLTSKSTLSCLLEIYTAIMIMASSKVWLLQCVLNMLRQSDTLVIENIVHRSTTDTCHLMFIR